MNKESVLPGAAFGTAGQRILGIVAISVAVLICAPATQARTIEFAGREWNVRTGEGGPGPNAWSDSPESVWVDRDGLHLKVRCIEGKWHCAEVTSVLPAKHGMHRFYVSSRVDLLDQNIVASPFLYEDDAHEVDIEFSRWRKTRGNNAQFVVQPYAHAGNIHRYEMRLNGAESTHCFDWRPDAIHFQSLQGHVKEADSASAVIQDWTYTGKDNPAEREGVRIHINLWLIQGQPPTDGKEAEFVLKDADLPGTYAAPAASQAKDRSEDASQSGETR